MTGLVNGYICFNNTHEVSQSSAPIYSCYYVAIDVCGAIYTLGGTVVGGQTEPKEGDSIVWNCGNCIVDGAVVFD